jgi:hypothetical protein
MHQPGRQAASILGMIEVVIRAVLEPVRVASPGPSLVTAGRGAYDAPDGGATSNRKYDGAMGKPVEIEKN